MKYPSSYYKIKWTAFFLTAFILASGFMILSFLNPNSISENETTKSNAPKAEARSGYFSNESFGQLIENTLNPYEFAENIHFRGCGEGSYCITADLKDAQRLVALCRPLRPYSAFLEALEGNTIEVLGHIGESESGNGCFIADTIKISDISIPAGITSDYIEEYSALNQLLEVPYKQITLNEDGITFSGALPEIIRIA